jgi:hypothetical protein
MRALIFTSLLLSEKIFLFKTFHVLRNYTQDKQTETAHNEKYKQNSKHPHYFRVDNCNLDKFVDHFSIPFLKKVFRETPLKHKPQRGNLKAFPASGGA